MMELATCTCVYLKFIYTVYIISAFYFMSNSIMYNLDLLSKVRSISIYITGLFFILLL